MAYIRVNHAQLSATASEIDAYISLLKSKMVSAQQEINQLTMNWQGSDSVQFKSQWGTVTDNQSTYYNLISQLESYANYLRYAAQEYSKAQKNAIDRANALPR